MARALVTFEVEDFLADIATMRELDVLENDQRAEYHIVMAHDASTPLSILDAMVDNIDAYKSQATAAWVLDRVAANPKSSSSLLNQIMKYLKGKINYYRGDSILISIARNPATSIDTLDILALFKKESVVFHVAGSGRASEKTLIRLSRGSPQNIRAAVAQVWPLPLEAVCNLWDDRAEWVAGYVKSNVKKANPALYKQIQKGIEEKTKASNSGFVKLSQSPELMRKIDQKITESVFRDLGMVRVGKPSR